MGHSNLLAMLGEGTSLIGVWYRIEQTLFPNDLTHWTRSEPIDEAVNNRILSYPANAELDQLSLMRSVIAELRERNPDTKYRIVRITEESIE